MLAAITRCKDCAACCSVRVGAEMVVLEGNEGVIGVDGPSEVDGDAEWE
jgi:hypothetical protein